MIVGLFRILLFILVFYLLIRAVRFILSYSSSGRVHNSSHKKTPRNEGDVTIDHIPDERKKVDRNNGEYVDFEEMDND